MSISVGRGTGTVKLAYLARLNSIRNYHPDVIFLHVGHKDLMAHPVYNKSPKHLKYLIPRLQSFCELLRENHPGARIVFSSVFPQTVGLGFNAEQKKKYNRLATRFGAMVRSVSQKENFEHMLNSVLWESVRQFRERAHYFGKDGLHLNARMKHAVAVEWMKTITKG
jgi:lysophospholipase L1-like esterase